jgi:hypothetical protein
MRRLVAILLLYVVSSAAQSPVSIEVHPEKPGPAIPSNFIGLSFETAAVLPNAGKGYLFHAGNTNLARLFQTLGIRSLRIGGNTADRPTVKIPDNTDIDNLFGFARVAGTRVIYTLRLRESTPEDAVKAAQYLMSRYQSDIDCLSIGNEPNIYFKDYSTYRDQLRKYMDGIASSSQGAGVKFCGPSTTPGKPEWARGFAGDFGASGRVQWVTQHSYPGGSGRKVQDATAGRDLLLSTDFQQANERLYELFAPQVLSNGLTYRLEETNNFFNGGAKDVSDTFASSLWGLDYLYWWAAHNAQGVNFHTGDNVAAGEQQTPCRYAVFWTSETGYSVHPLGYGIKAFELGSHGRLLPLQIVTNRDNVNLTAYAVLAEGHSLYITVINKEHGPAGRVASVTLDSRNGYAHVQEMQLTAPHNDVSAQSGITLGGASITDNGRWIGKWTPVVRPHEGRGVSFTIQPATAIVINLKAN